MMRRVLSHALLSAAIIGWMRANAATVNVDVGPNGSMSFSPAQVSVNAGDTVQWTWRSSPHSVTSGSPSNPTGLFDSGMNNAPFTFSETFSNPGSFPYYCTVHGAFMSGTVQVSAIASPTPTPTPTPTATPLLPRIGKGPVRIELQTVLTGVTSPIQWLSANDGTGRIFLVEQTGKIRIFNNGALNTTPFLDVSSRLVALSANYDERGLLSMAFHPGFSNPSSPGYRKIYTYTSEPVNGAADFTVPVPTGFTFNHQSVVAEWQVSAGNPDVIDPATRREVMRIDEPQSNHNGCTLAFRPSDRYLYISLGDGGAADDAGTGHNPTTGNGQDLTTVLGKILRIDPLAPALTSSSADPISANGKYRVPISNPFVATTQPANRVVEIYSLGLRNVFRFSFDPPSDKLVAADVGQDHVEEIDLIEAGKNYGWNRKEGTFLFNSNGSVSPDPSPDPALTNPLAQYSHDDGIAVLGGFVYRGSGILALPGKYVFGDLVAPGSSSGRLFYLDDLTSATIKEFRIGNDERALGSLLKGFGQDASGELYVLADTNIGPTGTTGRILKIIPAPASPALVNIATRMRVQTGDNVLIGGFILTGSAPKKVIVRAIGPSLSANGQPLPGRLLDPTLTLFDGTGSPLFTNDDWMNSPQKQAIIDSTVPPSDPKESAIVATLQPGNYTAIMSGVGSNTGIGVVELFDLDQPAPANPANISSRGFVESGDNVMIGGFIVGGSQNRTVLARAIGPSLTAVGVANALQDPTLELHDSSGTTIASNDNWKSNQQAQISATGLAPSDDREAAILSAPLAPGNYTAIVRGTGTNTGVAVVEIFQLP